MSNRVCVCGNYSYTCITLCANYICRNCIDTCIFRNNHKGYLILCCIKCILSITNYMYTFSMIGECTFIRQIEHNGITWYEYDIDNKIVIYSIINFHEQETEIYNDIRSKTRRQLDDFFIKDLLNIVIKYLYYKNDLFFIYCQFILIVLYVCS